MELDVSGVAGQPGKSLEVPLTVRLDPADVGDDLLAIPGDLSGTAQVFGSERGALLHLQLKGQVEIRCARCLQPFRLPVHLQISEEFRTGPATAGAAELQSDKDGSTFVQVEDGAIPVDEVVRQHLLLALPMKPLCREDCAGLCPRCGANLNEGACQCQPEAGDPRFAALRKLLDSPEAGQ